MLFAHAESENIKKAKWIIVGIPSEIGSLSNVKNYIEAPDSIREGSYRVFDTVFGNINKKEIFDYGNLELEDIKDLNKIYEKIYDEVRRIYDPEKKYIFLGGDHSITYPIIKLLRNYHDFYLLFFDSHPDCHPDPYPNYQSFIYYLIKEDILNPDKIIMIGLSNFSSEEKKILKEKNIKYYTSFEIWDSVETVIEEILDIVKENKIYFSIDMDVFDMGCGHWLEPFGIRPYHFFKIILSLKEKNLVGFDIVELYPNEICENLAAKIILELLSVFK